MLEVEGLSVSYGAVRALEDVTLSASAGSTTAVLGANGAGKSSLLRAISGIAPASSGRIRLEGRDVTALTPQVCARNWRGRCRRWRAAATICRRRWTRAPPWCCLRWR